jgi:hypothetical protein
MMQRILTIGALLIAFSAPADAQTCQTICSGGFCNTYCNGFGGGFARTYRPCGLLCEMERSDLETRKLRLEEERLKLELRREKEQRLADREWRRIVKPK